MPKIKALKMKILKTLPFMALWAGMSLAQASTPPLQTIVLAGGCFWGVEAVFEHTKGVTDAVSGYAGGSAADARYDIVSTGTTAHAEAVKVTFDPAKVSLEKILDIYFTVAHDPTQLNYQGPDHGTQYRSEVFYTAPEQGQAVQAYIAKLSAAAAKDKPVVTKVEALDSAFYPAEEHHQNFAQLNPYYPYILVHDKPKVAALEEKFPDLYRAETTMASAP